MKRLIEYIGGLLVLSTLPVFLALIWGDNYLWWKVLMTQFIIIAFIMLWYKSGPFEETEQSKGK